MRILFYIILLVALWYLTKSVIRYYVAGARDKRELRDDEQTEVHSPHENYRNARDARFRDVE